MTLGGRWRFALIVIAGAAMLAPYGVERALDAEPEPAPTGPPSLLFQRPIEGSVLAGSVAEVALEASGVPRGSRYAVLAGVAPPAVGEPLPRERGVVDDPHPVFAVGGLKPGPHRLVAVLVDEAGLRIGDALASVNIRMTGPVLTATASQTAVEGEPWVIDVEIADGVTIARGGMHLHYMIDLDLPPPGVPIKLGADNIVHTTETSVPLIGLEAGKHHVWVVAADGDDWPLVPYVADRITVEIVK